MQSFKKIGRIHTSVLQRVKAKTQHKFLSTLSFFSIFASHLVAYAYFPIRYLHTSQCIRDEISHSVDFLRQLTGIHRVKAPCAATKSRSLTIFSVARVSNHTPTTERNYGAHNGRLAANLHTPCVHTHIYTKRAYILRLSPVHNPAK